MVGAGQTADIPPFRPRMTKALLCQHVMVIVHCRAAQAVPSSRVEAVGIEATGPVFGRTKVSFRLTTTVVDCYADAK
jgi:hypothetical protein